MNELRIDTFLSFFLLLVATDLFTMQSRGPFYNSEFVVSHIEIIYENPYLPSLIPSGKVVSTLFFFSMFVILIWVFDIRWSFSIPTVTAIYGYIYFSSRIDNYQHHYMIFFVLLVLSFHRQGKQWPVRLLCCFVGIVYFWTAITKLTGPDWRTGELTKVLIGPLPFVSKWFPISTEEGTPHLIIAWATIAVEGWLAIGWIVLPYVGNGCLYERREATGEKESRLGGLKALLPLLSFVTWGSGTMLHLTIMLSGRFRLRFFSPYMIVIYFLLLPRFILVKLAEFRICKPEVQ